MLLACVLAGACGGSKPAARPTPTATSRGAVSGPKIYAERCAVCHGDRGEGKAGSRLAGGTVVRRFPRPEDEAAVVRNGAAGGSMPAFGDVLSPEQIDAVVAYTRSL